MRCSGLGPLPRLQGPGQRAPTRARKRWTYSTRSVQSRPLALAPARIVAYDKTDYCGASDSGTAGQRAGVHRPRAVLARLRARLRPQAPCRRVRRAAARHRGRLRPDGRSSDEGPRMLHLSPGARFFFSDASHQAVHHGAARVRLRRLQRSERRRSRQRFRGPEPQWPVARSREGVRGLCLYRRDVDVLALAPIRARGRHRCPGAIPAAHPQHPSDA